MKRATCSSFDKLTFPLSTSIVMNWMSFWRGAAIYTCRASQAGMQDGWNDALGFDKP